MSRIIGDRTKSALDEMEEVARARNRDVAEEEKSVLKQGPETEKPAEPGEDKVLPLPAQADYIKKANGIADAIEDEISFNRRSHVMGYRLYRHGPNSDSTCACFTADQAAMALLNKLTGKKMEYLETVEGIKNCIGRKPSFWRSKPTYYNSSDDPRLNTKYSLEANALMAVIEIMAGNRDNAGILIQIAETKSRRNGSLLIHADDDCLTANRLMTLAYAGIGDTRHVRAIMDEMPSKAEELLLATHTTIYPVLREIASWAMVEMFFKNSQTAKDSISFLEHYKSTSSNSPLFGKHADNEWPVYTNALIGCAYAMLGGRELFI